MWKKCYTQVNAYDMIGLCNVIFCITCYIYVNFYKFCAYSVCYMKVETHLHIIQIRHGTNKYELKSRQVYFKQTQLIGGTFPRHFFKKLKQKSKQWHTTRKRTSQNSICQKKKFKIVWEKFQHRVGSICSKLDSTLVSMQYEIQP